MLLHNKPYVYALALPKITTELPPSFSRLVEMERRVTGELLGFLRQNNIRVVDTVDEMIDCFKRGVRPFPESTDHHPDKTGYEAIARAILPMLDAIPKKR